MINPSKSKKSYDWSDALNSDWSLALSDLTSLEYSVDLNNFIEQVYLSGNEVYPKKNNLFLPFR